MKPHREWSKPTIGKTDASAKRQRDTDWEASGKVEIRLESGDHGGMGVWSIIWGGRTVGGITSTVLPRYVVTWRHDRLDVSRIKVWEKTLRFVQARVARLPEMPTE